MLSLLLALFVVGSLAATQPCPQGWIHEPQRDYCYLIDAEKRSWNASVTHCANVTGGDLVSIWNKEEYGFLHDLSLAHNVQELWLGLYRDQRFPHAYIYVWEDGTLLNYTRWLPNEPADRDGCFAWCTAGGYHSASCEEKRASICKQRAAKCGRTAFSDPSGNLTSPNWPNAYDNNLDCAYRISVPEGNYIQVTVEVMDLEYGLDLVQLFDGPDDSFYLIHNLTGHHNDDNVTFQTTAHEATLRFRTNSLHVFDGFLIYYKAVPIPPPVVLTGLDGIVSSPNYPNNYPSPLLKYYQVIVPEDRIAQINVLDCVTQYHWDFLRIVDGPHPYNRTIMTMSGEYVFFPLTLNATQNVVTLIFDANFGYPDHGWQIDFAWIPKS